jgi:hypothetical protein
MEKTMSKQRIESTQVIPPLLWLALTGSFLALVLIFSGSVWAADGSAGAACDLPPLLEEGKTMKSTVIKENSGPTIPGLDARVSGEVRTATFAMG